MRFHEQIYTSAAELLNRSAANLGVVAQTHDFPTTADAALSTLRAYTILRDIPLENVEAHPPRLVIGPIDEQAQWYGLSQVVFAGADHTGRTTPLAHHLLFRCDELRSPGSGPWSVARAAKERFRRQWKESPHWIEPAPQLQQITDVENFPFPLKSWKRVLGAVAAPILFNMAESILDFSTSQRPCVVCIDRQNAHSAIDYIGDLLALLPESIQFHRICISHVVDASDYVHNSALILTYPGTPFLEQCRHRQDPRAPVIFDLTRPDMLPARNGGQYGAALAKQAGSPSSIFDACREWDRLELKPGDGGEFHLILKVRDALQEVADARSVESVAAQLTQISDRPAVRKRIEDWSLEMLQRRLAAGDWGLVTLVCFDTRWPAAVRQAAWRTIQQSPVHTAPYLVAQMQTKPERSTELWSALQQLNKAHPSLADDSIQRALRSGAPHDAQTALALLQTSCADLSTLANWTVQVLAKPGDSSNVLFPSLKQAIDKAVTSEVQLRWLYDFAMANVHDGQFGRNVLSPQLRSRLASGALEAHWDEWTCHLIMQGLYTGVVADELKWLMATFGERIRTDTTVRQWLQAAAQTPYGGQLFMLVQASGLAPALESGDEGGDRLNFLDRNVRAAGGPLWTPRILTCILFVVAVLQYLLAKQIIHLPPEWTSTNFWEAPLPIPFVLSIPAIGWLVWECLFRWGPNSIRRTKTVYGVRWSLTSVLGLTLAVTVWLYAYKPIKSWFDSMQAKASEGKKSTGSHK